MQCPGETHPSRHGRATEDGIAAGIGLGWEARSCSAGDLKRLGSKQLETCRGFIRVVCVYQLFYSFFFQLYAKVFKGLYFLFATFCSLVQKLNVSIRTACRCEDE